MKKYTFKRQLLFVVFMLLGCLAIHAADDDLITKQITIKSYEAGTLSDKISNSKKYKITNLKIVGNINGTDVKLIREMVGVDAFDEPTNGKLAILDLSDVKINVGGDWYSYSNGYCYKTSDNSIGNCFFHGCSSLTNVILPSGVKDIRWEAFGGCSSLTSIEIPSSVTSIGSYAFEGCSSLTSIAIPSSVTSIEGGTFSCCSSLTSVDIPSSVWGIGSYAFEGCSSLTSVVIPSSVTSIDNAAFKGCSSLTSIEIPSGVRSIGSNTFEGCSSLISVVIPSSVTSIDDVAFKGCSSLTSVDIPSSVWRIGSYAFSGCSSLTSVVIPSSVSEICSNAFEGCSLTSVYVSWKTPKGGAYAFKGIDKTACTLYVPQGTKDDYWLSSWGDVFDNIEEYDVTGIDQVANGGEAKEVSRYSVDGKRLDAPAKGLNIVRYSDGSVKKIAVQ